MPTKAKQDASWYTYVVVTEGGNSDKHLYKSLSKAEDFAKWWSSELSRSEITTFVLHIPPPAQPRIHHADDVNQFTGEDWRVAKAYYKGKPMAKGRFKRWGIYAHEPRKAKEEARAAAIKATAAEFRKEQELEYQAQRQAAQKEAAAAMAKQKAENKAWDAKSDSTLISEAKKHAKIMGDATKSDPERYRAKTQVEKRLRELATQRGRDVSSLVRELSSTAAPKRKAAAKPVPAAAAKPPRTPAPTIPTILTPAPAAASDMASVPVRLGGGGIAPIPGVGAGVAPAKKRRQPAAKPAAKPRARAAAPPAKKAKKTAAKPAAKSKAKKPAPELTAAQKKRLAAKGSITIKRGGKFVTVTR